jgi:iron complex transport system ATP-binding protein
MTPLLNATQLRWRTRVDGISLKVEAGEVVGIIGPNGAGKSSLLKLLAGLQQADSGELLLVGKALAQHAPLDRARLLGYLEQRPVLHWPFTVRQVVALGRLPHGDAECGSGVAAIAAAMTQCDVARYATRNFLQLSEGEKMRVQLARLLAGQPRVLLADEPTASLDPARQHEVMALLRQQAKTGCGVVVTLHDLTTAARYCDRLLLLQQGRVLASGTAANVLTPALLAQTFQIDASFDTSSATVIIQSPPLA